LNKRVYVNPKQKQFLQGKAKRRTFVGGRGSGKTATIGFMVWLCFNNLPRAKFFLAGMTYDQLLTKSWPSIKEALSMMGLDEYEARTGIGHYVVCKKPPEHWLKPWMAPADHKHCITFLNGFTLELLSLALIESRRGGSYDGGFIDESALVPEDAVSRVLLPSIRGNSFRFTHYLHQTVCDFTSVPWKPAGQWVFKVEELAKEDPAGYEFVEATVYDNLHIWGGLKRLEQIKKMTPVLEWDVEYMNKRLAKLPNSFYPAFDAEKHVLFRNLVREVYDEERGLWLTSDYFLDTKQPLETSWDFNAAFTSMIVCQERGNELRIGDELYLKNGDVATNKIDGLVDKFVERYKHWACQEVLLHGDRNGNNKQVATNQTFYEQIAERLRKAGWEVTPMVTGLDPDHQLKHKYINALLAEEGSLPRIRINQHRCKYTIVSIQNSPITSDWKKDKSSEKKLADHEQERATHLSDCFDNIVYRKYAHLFGTQSAALEAYFMPAA
jgi:hypothetical protein